MKPDHLLFVCTLALAGLIPTSRPADAQLERTSPVSVGMSSERIERIGRMVDRKIEQGQLVGAVTAVAREGKLVHFRASGFADLEAKRPMTKDAVFRIYSMTKPITTVAAMMLYEDGAFQLDDPVADYLPALRDVKVLKVNEDGTSELETPRRPMTVRDLMAHTSGLTYGLFGDSEVDGQYRAVDVLDRSQSLEQMVDKLGELPLLCHPGERWNYSVSTDVLGRFVEVVSGQTLDDFFRDRIFGPLGMEDTAFFVRDDQLDRFPVTYRWATDGQHEISDAPEQSRFRSQPKNLSGGGGLVSTTSDYLRFCQMLLNGGRLNGVQLLSPKTIRLMTMNHLDNAQLPSKGVQLGAGCVFGLGFRVVEDPSRNQRLASKGTYGWGGMASTMFFIDPQEKLIGLIMTQKLPTDLRLRDEFQTAVYQAIVETDANRN